MSDKTARGTKRSCQNGSCGARFYDLGRDPIVCPICGSKYTIARGPVEPDRDDSQRRAARKPEPIPAIDAEVAPDLEVDDALVDVEGTDEPVADAADDTFLEEEEDAGGDVGDILGGPGAEDEET